MKAIAAMSYNLVIGKDGGIPWKCKADMLWFKEFTMGKSIVFGRTTFEKMPFLAGRKIYVLAHSPINSPHLQRYGDNLVVVKDIDTLPRDCIIAGGSKVYQELLPHCTDLYLTVIKQTVEGDTSMPTFRHLFRYAVLKKTNEELDLIHFFN